jgi:thiamine-monophosphate kinase
MTTLHQLGEREVIRRLAKFLPSRDDVRVGIGDDAAVVSVEGGHKDFLLASDSVIEGTHFLPDAPPEQIGHKAIGRVLSDFAAMGGEPLWALIDVVANRGMPIERLAGVYKGAAKLAEKYGLAIVGGDLADGPTLELHVFGVGEIQKKSAILRSGAKTDDVIYVTGSLGGSLRGRHLTFEPRLEEGLWLRESRWANAMIDISDGLATDLGHIVERSKAGAEIIAERIPVSDESRAIKDNRTPLEHALFDGEDFELLFTVSSEKQHVFESSWGDVFDLPCTAIGRITDPSGGIVLVGAAGEKKSLRDAGYEHFSGR